MSTIDQAAQVIAEANLARRDRRPATGIVTVLAAREYAHALAGAGLLAPDLPEPTEREDAGDDYGAAVTWETSNPAYSVFAYEHPLKGKWRIGMESAPSDVGPEYATELGLALIAAARHAKEANQ